MQNAPKSLPPPGGGGVISSSAIKQLDGMSQQQQMIQRDQRSVTVAVVIDGDHRRHQIGCRMRRHHSELAPTVERALQGGGGSVAVPDVMWLRPVTLVALLLVSSAVGSAPFRGELISVPRGLDTLFGNVASRSRSDVLGKPGEAGNDVFARSTPGELSTLLRIQGRHSPFPGAVISSFHRALPRPATAKPNPNTNVCRPWLKAENGDPGNSDPVPCSAGLEGSRRERNAWN